MAEWTDELKREAVEAYKKLDPNPENTMECVKMVAEKLDVTPNGLRNILTKAGVYIKKEAATTSSKSTESSSTKKVSKADAQNQLIELITALGKEPDEEIIGKLTGKAALYLVEVFSDVNDVDDED